MAKISSETRNLLKGLAFVSPWLVGFCAFMLLPIVLSLYYSFCDFNLIQKPVFIGADNYRQLIHDGVFWGALWRTLYYAALLLPAGLAISLAVAILLNQNVRGQSIFRTMIFLPSLVPTIAAAILWKWMFNQRLGLINRTLNPVLGPLDRILNAVLHVIARGLGTFYVLFHLHVPHWLNYLSVNLSGPPWLDQPGWVIPALAMMSLWSVGNTVVIYLAGLQDVPRELYEAADLDGANSMQQMWHVTLPMISPVIFFNLIMAIIGVLQVFDMPFMMTSGGPNRASYFFTYYLYDEAFTYLKMGYASAMAWVQLILVLLLTALAFWSSRRWVHYQGK